MFDLSPNHKGPTSDDEIMATIWTNAAITNHIPNYADLLEALQEEPQYGICLNAISPPSDVDMTLLVDSTSTAFSPFRQVLKVLLLRARSRSISVAQLPP